MRVLRRNLTSRAHYYKSADGIFVSVPKSGRTWVRVFLYHYFSTLLGLSFTLNEKEIFASRLPKLIFTHDLWEHRAFATPKNRWRGRYLVPRRAAREKRIVLLSRDPRDVIVSLFFQVTKRMHRYDGTLSDMLRHPRFGIGLIIDVMNAWIAEWGDSSNCKLVRYEDCQADTETTFRELLGFLSPGEIDRTAFNQSLSFSSFENMKALEGAGKFGRILSPGDSDDPESFKVRRGEVGAFEQYFTQSDLEYLRKDLARLDKRYGYSYA
ncbi:MAG TPA: sulfotransferase domain-containing protein [Verrucomicrobiae bacterium]|nr:sulfotransferase domain-containing protein [Verrucomicrobiae bacterium]